MGEESVKKYAILQPDEDGNPFHWIKREQLNDINRFMENYTIKRFLEEVPEESDPNYWKDGDTLLLEVTIKKVVPVEVVERYEIK